MPYNRPENHNSGTVTIPGDSTWNAIINWLSGSKQMAKQYYGRLKPTYMFRVGPFKVSGENPLMLWNDTKAYDGAAVSVVETASGQTIGAGMISRAVLWTSLDSVVSGKLTDNTPDSVHFDRVQEVTYMWASNHFVVTPFVALLENGQTVTTTEAANGDVDTLANLACGAGTRIIFFGPALAAHPYFDGGQKFALTLGVNPGELANLYAQHLEQFQIESRTASALALKIGCVFSSQQNTTISYQDLLVTLTHSVPRELTF